MTTKRKRAAGRLPLPMPDTHENVARAILTTPKKRGEWKFLRDREKRNGTQDRETGGVRPSA